MVVLLQGLFFAMPVRPEVHFGETASTVTVTVSMCAGGLSRQRLQVFCSPLFVKLSCLPYLLALDLYERVEHRSVHCTVDEAAGQVVVHLAKAQQGLWGSLSPTGNGRDLFQRLSLSTQSCCLGRRRPLQGSSAGEAKHVDRGGE